ncbi:PLC-like phosphodiesterase [Lasiosphaeria miniovina]|uniref:PLC-like phosphodiesterase n=1 Tax=Lasiosphaeria miniovina TaxID=1954250 RepID=A0AA40DVS5_9PEZI|nr:PLC-like phosphodiesterase [Lasiosphaeria miniovina]KAK0718159.1 PLC-like phosphodiesterase [Lasiosphaeria miniovina]
MAWVAHGSSELGFIQTAGQGQSRTVPAVAAYRGRLWCLWADLDGNAWCAVTDDDGNFGGRMPFPQAGLPVMENLNGHLHVVVVLESGDIDHYILDDEPQRQASWVHLGPLPGATTLSSPCLVAFHNRLFLAFVDHNGKLYYTAWTTSNPHPSSASDIGGAWSDPKAVSSGDIETFRGIPALFVTNGTLHLLCASASEPSEILCYAYDPASSGWSPCHDITEGRAARGISATSYGETAYMGFIENTGASADRQGDSTVTIASFLHGKWQPHEPVGGGQRAADPPQIAILNGRIHCIFNDATATKDLRWYSRPILAYSMASWMAALPDTTLLSNVTIPGTHDSCARSYVPFVRTQYLSIGQQLALGIRFIDLRLRRHDDGSLFCYHGGIPLGFPRGLSFVAVMDQVWAFLRGPHHTLSATETVLVSINNDDVSDDQHANPGIFYQAVDAAVAAAAPYPDGTPRWFLGPVTPRLGNVRGRAVVLRRYPGDPAVAPRVRTGLDLSDWVDDSPDFTIVTPTNVRVRLQDKWKFSSRISLADLVASKSGFVRSLMLQAAARPPPPMDLVSSDSQANPETDEHNGDWYINFCSAVGDPVEHGELAEAKWIAVGARTVGLDWVDGMNRQADDARGDYVGVSGRVRLGVVNMDYPELPADNDLVARLIETNF